MGLYRLSAELRGHSADVRCCAVIDDNLVVTGSRDNKLILWRREEGRNEAMMASEGSHSTKTFFAPVRSFEGHAHFVNAVKVVSSDLIASASADKTVRIW